MLEASALVLVNGWQRGFPLVPRPFAEIAERSSLAEDEVLRKFQELKTQGVIDRIGPVLRPHSVGASTLAAMAVPTGRLADVAAFVSGQPGVNHNYEREHPYNLWFVVHGATDADVAATLARIGEASGLQALRLPLLEEFHIDLGFDLDTHAAPRGFSSGGKTSLSSEEKNLLKATASGLPIVPRPYEALAKNLGISEAQVISLLQKMLGDGRIRRIGAVIRHRRVGYEANAMLVWDVPDGMVRDLGAKLAGDSSVSLCYLRARALPEWPYNLYCMLHGRERARVLFDVKRITAAYGLGRFPRAVLFSRRCFAQRAASHG